MNKILFIGVLFFLLIFTIHADDLANILQDLAVQTACLGMYSTAETGVYVTSRHVDPPDWYTPRTLANRFAAMSGNMTRIDTFYGVCFDYAQFAWDDIFKYQKMYNDAGMKGTQWYIAMANAGNPNTIILYDPVSQQNATIISNGVYLKENSRYNVYAHDGASGHAWLWVQHNNGTWYWIDPTWTDNLGYPWWGIVKNGKEVQYYPDPQYCVTSNYPKPGANNTETRSPDSTYTNYTYYRYIDFMLGYNYSNNMPIGFTIGGLSGLYASFNQNIFDSFDDDIVFGSAPDGTYSGETKEIGFEFTAGYSFYLNQYLRLPIGIGMSMTDECRLYNYGGGNVLYSDDFKEFKNRRFIMEAGLQFVFFDFLYLMGTYRLIGFEKNSFSIGAGIVF